MSEVSMWADLPECLAIRTLRLLGPIDVKTMRLVCTSWNERVTSKVSTLRPRTLGPAQAARLNSNERFPMLHSLDCSQVWPPITRKTMKVIVRLPKLQELYIEGGQNTGDALLADIAKATGLTSLHLHSFEALTDGGLSAVTNLSSLKVLCLGQANSLLGCGFSCLESLADLRELLIQPCENMQGLAILSLAKLTQLSRLELNGFPFDSDLDIITDHDDANVDDTAEQMRTGLTLAHGEGWQEVLLQDAGFQAAVGTRPDDNADFLALTQQRDLFLDRLASLESFSAGIDIWTLKGKGRTMYSSWLTSHLSRLTSLTSVVIGDFERRLQARLGIEDTGYQTFERIFPALATLKGLKQLDLMHIEPMTGMLWEPLATLESLEYAGIYLAVMKTEVCPSITKLSCLTGIHIRVHGRIEKDALQPVAKLPKLEHVDLSNVKCRFREFDSWPLLATASSLTCFNISNCFTTGMRYGQVLSSFKKLECIAFTKVLDCPGGVAAHLAGLPFLTEIHLHNCTGLKDSNLFHLQKLDGLEHLSITTNQIGPGLVVVKHLTALTSLDMSETNVSDAELAAVSNLKHLRSLYAGKTKISSRGLQHLRKLTALQELAIDSNRAIRESEMVEHVRGLALNHSLATVFVSPYQVRQGLGQHLPCRWSF